MIRAYRSRCRRAWTKIVRAQGTGWQGAPPPPPKNIQARHFQSGGRYASVDKTFRGTERLEADAAEQRCINTMHSLWTGGSDHPDGVSRLPHDAARRGWSLVRPAGCGCWQDTIQDESISHSKQQVGQFSAYQSKQELNDRYGKLHDYMEADTNDWEKSTLQSVGS